MKIKFILILFAAALTFSGCTSVSRTVTIETHKENVMANKCRLDHYSCNQNDLFTPGMEVMKKLLQEHGLDAEYPELAEIGFSCDLDIENKISQDNNNQSAWFVSMELEFYRMPGILTIRKTVLKGHCLTKKDTIVLIADMTNRFLDQLGPASSVEVELASGWTEYDKQGCNELLAGNYGKAITLFRKAIDKRPDDHNTRYNLGVTYEKMGRLDQAELCYQKAYELAGLELYKSALQRVQQ